MSGVVLHQISMKRESKSFTDSLHAILSAAGLFDGPKYILSGLSGMAFKFSVHKRLLPMSVSAYGQWGTEHRPAVDNLGVFTESDGGRTRHPTFRYYREDAVRGVKCSLERGIGVVYWLPEFGVIHGYDDEDGVFFVQDGRSPESQIVLYENFGINSTPFWYIQLFGDRIHIEQPAMVLESLRLAIHDWDTPHKTLPDTEMASGKLAYAYLVRGLDSRDYDERGAVYILNSYLYARREIEHYLHDVGEALPGLDEAADIYSELVRTVSPIEGCLVDYNGSKRVNPECIGELRELLLEAESLEEQAIERFRSISERYPDRKRSTVPRWGIHTPR
ncbi:hypothetical protein FE783_10415 [Paenibacillus mesophilus]|uniref:hypothetical protein n=1 Tax=Paenibacillus mesophilus TaxID=2582849 RepID=UPI00110E6493|nr:hypothetical protein [Paenibacillus mesophilus]TMV49978.1 hypothetical protein FE783_10415 [Paenibacillus mesophilus]